MNYLVRERRSEEKARQEEKRLAYIEQLSGGDDQIRLQLGDWNLAELILLRHSRPSLFDVDLDPNPYRTE